MTALTVDLYIPSPTVADLSRYTEMGIDLELWRAMIGGWHARQTRLRGRRSFSRQQEEKVMGVGVQLLLLLFVAALIPMLLQLGGDVELNPGPPKKQGKNLPCLHAMHTSYLIYAYYTSHDCFYHQ